jgi:hypothetical protein
MKCLLLSCITVLFLLSCKKNNNAGTVLLPEFFPNKVGDEWTYKVTDSAFTLQNFSVATQYTMNISIIDSVQLPGGITAMVWVYAAPGLADTNYVFQKADTVFFAANTLPAINIIRQYIVPLQLHNSWKYTSHSVHNVTVDTQSHIIVGPYEFDNAFHIQGYPGRPDEIFNLEEWLADDAGVVKRYFNNVHSTNNPYEHITSWSLLSYHLE